MKSSEYFLVRVDCIDTMRSWSGGEITRRDVAAEMESLLQANLETQALEVAYLSRVYPTSMGEFQLMFSGARSATAIQDLQLYQSTVPLGSNSEDKWATSQQTLVPVDDIKKANLVSSQMQSAPDMHMPLFDIDHTVANLFAGQNRILFFQNSTATLEGAHAFGGALKRVKAITRVHTIPRGKDYNDVDMYMIGIEVSHHVRLFPSKTPGHFHLAFTQLKVPPTQLMMMLEAFVAVGIVEGGYYEAAKAQHQTFIRAWPTDTGFYQNRPPEGWPYV
jgi:hypothetical protein